MNLSTSICNLSEESASPVAASSSSFEAFPARLADSLTVVTFWDTSLVPAAAS